MKTSIYITLTLFLLVLPYHVQAQVDYESEIQPIFDQHCTSCHGNQSGVTLSSYNAVMNSVGNQYGTEIVAPRQPDQSPLVDKIEPNPQFGSRMPQGGTLSNEEIDLIRTWISEGANEVPVSNEITEEIPNGFELKENYPNPFNPQTIVTFLTPENAHFNLEIYNTNGILIKSISGLATTGPNNVTLNMQNQPSGVYFYRIKIMLSEKSFWLNTQKMTLLK